MLESGRMRPQTRDRLVGMLLLVLLAAILSPFIFRSPDEVRLALDMDIPDAPEVRVPDMTPAVPEDEVEEASEQILEAHDQVVEIATENPGREPLQMASSEEQAVTPSGWSVQVASFASEKAARDLDRRLRNEDYHAYVRRVEQDGESLYRVFVGPELSRSAADRLRDRLASDTRFKLAGFVTPYRL